MRPLAYRPLTTVLKTGEDQHFFFYLVSSERFCLYFFILILL